MLQTGKAAGRAPNDSGLPVDVEVVPSKPGKPQGQRQTRLVQDVELDLFPVVTGEEHVNWSSLMGDMARTGTWRSCIGLDTGSGAAVSGEGSVRDSRDSD